ncbi:hypothetical protein ACFYKX_10590 [Cytobacillus sp. FJAT-54145]|uniref:Uncharacterized protein n=1 Tax=Cytobacillus spartinae TaxID=3299023 RepID=A0ABW6KBU1_9BACI
MFIPTVTLLKAEVAYRQERVSRFFNPNFFTRISERRQKGR